VKPTPTLEVCIPTRKRGEYFAQTVESVARAATADLSLLVFQNSTQPIWHHADLAPFHGDKRLECSGSDLPMAESWNAILHRSRGKWIHLLHDDDWVEPSIYQVFQRDVASHPPFACWLCGTTDHFFENGVARTQQIRHPDLYTVDATKIAELILEQALTRCASIILRREVALQLGGFDPRMKHTLDVDLFLRVALAGGALFSPLVLGNYRIHTGSSTGMGQIFRRGELMRLPVLDDRRMLEDHMIFLSKQEVRNLRLPPFRRHSAGQIYGAFRYYLRRGRIGSLIIWFKYFARHLWTFTIKARRPVDDTATDQRAADAGRANR
jgi:hypothetical protein